MCSAREVWSEEDLGHDTASLARRMLLQPLSSLGAHPESVCINTGVTIDHDYSSENLDMMHTN